MDKPFAARAARDPDIPVSVREWRNGVMVYDIHWTMMHNRLLPGRATQARFVADENGTLNSLWGYEWRAFVQQ